MLVGTLTNAWVVWQHEALVFEALGVVHMAVARHLEISGPDRNKGITTSSQVAGSAFAAGSFLARCRRYANATGAIERAQMAPGKKICCSTASSAERLTDHLQAVRIGLAKLDRLRATPPRLLPGEGVQTARIHPLLNRMSF